MNRTDRHHHTPLALTATALAALLVPLATACGGEKAEGGGSGSVGAAGQVTGVDWEVDSVTVAGTTHRAPSGAHVRIGDDGRAEGNFGCNPFSARARQDGDRLRVSDARSTEMACAQPAMAFEDSFSDALTGGDLTARTQGDTLTLTTEDGDTVRMSEQQNADLAGTRWNIEDSAGRAHLTFDPAKHTVTGSLGCNRVNAEATVSDGHITLGRAATTRMMCEDSLMAVEKRLLRLFDARASYAIDGRNLTLTSENGTVVRAVAAD
ncbi:META domain-containing protein [Streptomyces sp. NPDC048182]|uniref:META domain-containing protein n=1 Tax=Streptomyces sp. NPDC048182 TaxID=3365507 RepID=UPI003711AE65